MSAPAHDNPMTKTVVRAMKGHILAFYSGYPGVRINDYLDHN
jgi:hypothetical protein